MPRYEVRFVTYAAELRASLHPDARHALDVRLDELADDPRRNATHDTAQDCWYATFAAEQGLIQYVISDRIVTVTVLRVTWAG